MATPGTLGPVEVQLHSVCLHLHRAIFLVSMTSQVVLSVFVCVEISLVLQGQQSYWIRVHPILAWHHHNFTISATALSK